MTRNIFLYCGKGVDEPLHADLTRQLKEKFCCTPITAHQIHHSDWPERADVLVIPGGRDLPYVECLHPYGTDRIKEYVLQGGRFLGICAGAYFASGFVEFDMGGGLEVKGDRPLKFFPGTAIGPLFGPFEYESEKGAKIVSLSYRDGKRQFPCRSYYNGGCFFESASPDSVVAVYEDGRAAIVRCRVGKGLAILSGVHFEKPLPRPHAERERQQLMSALLEILKIGYSGSSSP
jgi:biotin--protein ligase